MKYCKEFEIDTPTVGGHRLLVKEGKNLPTILRVELKGGDGISDSVHEFILASEHCESCNCYEVMKL